MPGAGQARKRRVLQSTVRETVIQHIVVKRSLGVFEADADAEVSADDVIYPSAPGQAAR